MTLSALQIPLELAYERRGLFAVELLDAATLERVYQGITVTAEGLRGKQRLNSSGIFFWLDKDFSLLRKIVVDPGLRPYEGVERAVSQLQQGKVNTIELPLRIDYPFPSGLTGLRGRLIEQQVAAGQTATPVANAKMCLQWRTEEDGQWRDSPTFAHTNKAGDFAAFLRLLPAEVPQLDPVDDQLVVRLRVSRSGFRDRMTPDFKLMPGRITNPTPNKSQTFAWKDLSL